MRSHLTSQPFSEHLRQADLSMLALSVGTARVVTARVLVVLSGSFTSQIETGPTLTWFSDSRGIHSPQCWEPDFYIKYITTAGTGDGTRADGVTGGCGNHYTTRTSLIYRQYMAVERLRLGAGLFRSPCGYFAWYYAVYAVCPFCLSIYARESKKSHREIEKAF